VFQTILSYLSFAVAWQGVLVVVWTAYSMYEYFAGKRETSGTSREEEKIKLIFYVAWFLLTLGGFYYDAVSSPPFVQAFSLVSSDLSVLVGYVSVFGSILCLAIYAPYKIVSSIVYLYTHKGSNRRPIQFHEDKYYGDMIVLETSLLTTLTGHIEVGGQELNVVISYPPLEDIPEALRKDTRATALSRSKQFCEQLKSRGSEYRTGLAYLLFQGRQASGRTLDQISAGLKESLVECEFWFEENNELDPGTFVITYKNTNDFGKPELFAGVRSDGGFYLIDEAEDLSEEDSDAYLPDASDVEQAEEFVEKVKTESDRLIDEVYVDEGDNSIKQSYL
jgi:hypothetical protein